MYGIGSMECKLPFVMVFTTILKAIDFMPWLRTRWMLFFIDSLDLKLFAKNRHLKEVKNSGALTEHMINLTIGC